MSISTHQSNFGSGGVHSYESIADRDSIHAVRRYWGMLCYVHEENNRGTYQLAYNNYNTDILDNRNWVHFSSSPFTVLQYEVQQGLSARTAHGASTSSLASGASEDLSITGHKTYILQWVETSSPAWVRIYCDAASRTADASRAIEDDPVLSGIVCEVVTSPGALKVPITPCVIGYNNDSPTSDLLYLSVRNLDSVAKQISVTMSLLKCEF